MVSLAMARSPSLLNWVLSAFLSLTLISPASAFDQNLCSSENTGSDSQNLYSIYASAGKCHDHCGGYSFAVVQGKNCWCSNIAPGDTVSVGQCSQACPGYPYENCGSESSGLFGYLALGKTPEGTQGAASSSSQAAPTSEAAPTTEAAPTSEAPQSKTSPDTVTVRATETATQPASISYISISPTPETTETTPTTTSTTSRTSTTSTKNRPTPTTSTTSSPSSSSSSWSPTPFASVKTVQGGVQTVTITPTAPPQAAQTEGQLPEGKSEGGFWNSTGKVAGTFTVVGIVIAAMIGAAMFFFLRKRNRQRGSMTINSIDEDAPTSSNGAPYMVDRRRSNLTLATAGLGGLTRGSSNDKSPNEKTPGSLSRRGSIPLSHDQRLNPAALWNTAHPNGSHASVASFRDDQDYSRPVLHVRNPDDPDR